MTHPNPRVTGAEVPEVEQEFDAEVARHQARLDADRKPCTRTDMPGLIGADMPCTQCGHRADQHPAWVEPVQDWYFTFGHGQYDRVTGEHLLGSYVVINGTYMGARERMVAAFGSAWCDQYVDAERAGVHEFNLRRIDLPTPVAAAPPVTPAEAATALGLDLDEWLGAAAA